MIINDGNITPNVATSAPKNPICEVPTNVAKLTAIGPGVDSAIPTMSMTSSAVSQPF